MKRSLAALFLVALAALLVREVTPAEPPSEFEVGQRWALKVGPKHRGAQAVVVKIDADPELGAVVFVDIDNLIDKDGQRSTFHFIPTSEQALRRSVDHYVERVSYEPSYSQSQYDMWKSQYMGGKRFIVASSLDKFLEKMWP